MSLTEKCDRLKFKKGKQNELLKLAAKSVGSIRGLARYLGLSWGHFWYYLSEKTTLPYSLFKKVLLLTNLNEKDVLNKYVEKILPFNWGASKGGIKVSKINVGKLKTDIKFREAWIKRSKRGGAKFRERYINNWDIGFRNIGRRKIIGPKGEKMFNLKEKNIADVLLANKLNYTYEPKINLNGHVYFPDFFINDIIIENAGFVNEKSLESIKRKIMDYSKFWKGQIYFIYQKNNLKILKTLIPKNEKFILISQEDFSKMASVA